MSTVKFEVVKFDRKINFTLWQVRMRGFLVESGVQKALKGDKPADMKEADWEDIDEKARSAIQLSLSDEVLREVISEKTTKALWEKLESLYLKKTLTNKLYKKQCLYSLRMSEGTSLGSHIDEFESLIMDLQNLDVNIEDEDQALLLLCSLPSSYRHFRETMLYGKDTISLKDVKTALETKEKIDHDITGQSSNSQAQGLYARGRPEQRGRPQDRGKSRGKSKHRSKSRGRDVICWYCKELGHVRSKCDKLQKKRENKVTPQNEETAQASVAEERADAKKAGSLYILQGSTITGSAAVSKSSMPDSEVTKLWHMRLGHMSEKGLTLLSKRGLLCGQSTESQSEEEIDVEDVPQEASHSIAENRPRREIRPPQRYTDFVAYALTIGEETDCVGEPVTYTDAISSLESFFATCCSIINNRGRIHCYYRGDKGSTMASRIVWGA
ncbi:hypothetical protein ACOSQ2_005141 [Xanthoceras sorbifolium]